MPDHRRSIAVYGATGHTGRLVVRALRRRGLPVVAVGRRAGAAFDAGVPWRVAALDQPAALDQAFADCALVINCAGPFLDTATPVIESAVRVRCTYLDVTAEQASARDTFERFDAPARAAGIAIVPAVGFYGGLADLLASAVVRDGIDDSLTIATALDHWWPTDGTRRTGARNQVPRVVLEHGALVPIAEPRHMSWPFAPPHGLLDMMEVPLTEVITIARHLPLRHVRAFLNTSAVEELRDTATPPPVAADADGRSAQQFAMEVVAQGPAGTRRAIARGRDIYATSADLVAEAAARALDPSFTRVGACAPAQAFDARALLQALTRLGVHVSIDGAAIE